MYETRKNYRIGVDEMPDGWWNALRTAKMSERHDHLDSLMYPRKIDILMDRLVRFRRRFWITKREKVFVRMMAEDIGRLPLRVETQDGTPPKPLRDILK